MNSLKFYRLQRDLTMKEMAEKIGISQSLYHYIEKGEANASEEVAAKICEILNVPKEGIFYPSKFRIYKLEEVDLIV